MKLKREGDKHFIDLLYFKALDCYLKALEGFIDPDLKACMLGNTGQCYLLLELFEDAIEYADMALRIDKDNKKYIYTKAKALAGLFEFEESMLLF